MTQTTLGVLYRHLVRTASRAALEKIDGSWHAGYIPTPRPAQPQTPEIQQMVFTALRYLIPRDLVGIGKCRIGGNDDGGYVFADSLTPAQPILSIGVGPDVSFDLEMAEKGHHILMIDHTVDALPAEHPNFTWHRVGVAATSQPEASMQTLAELAAMLPNTGSAPILKMDVEGAEWEVLANTSGDTLREFAQVGLELHDLLKLDDPEFNALVLRALRNLTADFAVIHVHGNNCGRFGIVGGFTCPDVLEITLIRRDLAATEPSKTWYPTNLDRSNWRGGVDLVLWGFPFAPGSETLELASLGA